MAPIGEICGNCIDDDGDGLTDLEDPACCDGFSAAPLTVKALRIKDRPAGPGLRLVVHVEGFDFASLKPSTRSLYVQFSPMDDAPLVCATIDAPRFRATRRRLRFVDRKGLVPEADGLDVVGLRVRRNGRAVLKIIGKGLAFATPATGEFRLTVGVRDLGVADPSVRCISGVERLETTRRGLRLP